MAQANPVNGACELKDPQVLNRDGVPSLALNVTIGQKTFTTTISALAGQTTWSEVQGVRPTGQAYWRFILSGGDSSHPGSVTALNWDVEGNDLRTKSLSVDYVDPTSGQPDSVQCL